MTTTKDRMRMSTAEKVELYILNHVEYRERLEQEGEQEGIWEIRNDEGQRIGLYSGKFKHVLDYAVEHPRFWGWGSGGHVARVIVTPVDNHSVQYRNQLVAKERKLAEELERVQAELKAL